MVFTISADSEHKYFEVYTKNQKFADCPFACRGRGGASFFVPLTRRDWYEQLVKVADWVNNELKDECIFEVD